jgi:ATP-dependent Lon protease
MGRLKVAGGIEGTMKESIQQAFAYIQGHKTNMGIAQAVDATDFHVEAIDLLANHIACDAGIGLVAICSALKKYAALPALLILGDLSIQGNIKAVRSLAEPLQLGMDNGARRALIPIENKRHFLDVSADIVERVDPIFYSDPMTAAEGTGNKLMRSTMDKWARMFFRIYVGSLAPFMKGAKWAFDPIQWHEQAFLPVIVLRAAFSGCM